MTMPKASSSCKAAALILGASFIPAHACGACGCTLNSDWASQGYTAMAGFRVDLRQDYFNQDQLRSGTHAPARSGFPIPNGQEIQQETLNRNTTLTLDYFTGKAWGINMQASKYVLRVGLLTGALLFAACAQTTPSPTAAPATPAASATVPATAAPRKSTPGTNFSS